MAAAVSKPQSERSTSKFTGLRGFLRRSGGLLGWAFNGQMSTSFLISSTVGLATAITSVTVGGLRR